MDNATLANIGRCGYELFDLLHRQLKHQPDSHLVEFVWRGGFATLLAEMIHRDQMSPAAMNVYLARICTELRATTAALVQHGDASGWPSITDSE